MPQNEDKSRINLDDAASALKQSLQKDDKQEDKEEKPIQDDELKRLKRDLLLALAEAENLRKRHAKEKEDLSKFAISSALSELSAPFENLFSALKVKLPDELKENDFMKSIVTGIEMVQKDFERIFAKLGLKRIFPEGQGFDPNLHQAVSQIEADGFKPGMVVQVISAGFELHGRILKPAMVVVSK